MNTITIVAIALWVITIIAYVIVNLYRKNKKLEEIVINQQGYIDEFLRLSKNIDKMADQIDSKIWVQSDPEFLSLMESVKEMQASIKQYTESN